MSKYGKFVNDKRFIKEFEGVKGIEYYPYVGKMFSKQQKRIMVFANLNYCHPDKYDMEKQRISSPTHFADAMDEFTFTQSPWTNSFRNFIKGSLELTEDYTKDSSATTLNKIDDFVSKISYTNYINDLVKSKEKIDVLPSAELLERSNTVNEHILDLLKITHCVCWGSMVFKYLMSLDSFEKVGEAKYYFQHPNGKGDFKKSGFSYIKLKRKKNEGIIHVLKIFHPSMPGFGKYELTTHAIFDWFYKQ